MWLHKNTRLIRVCIKQCYYSKYSNCQPSRILVPTVLSPLHWRDDKVNNKVLIICKEKCASASRYLILYYFINFSIFHFLCYTTIFYVILFCRFFFACPPTIFHRMKCPPVWKAWRRHWANAVLSQIFTHKICLAYAIRSHVSVVSLVVAVPSIITINCSVAGLDLGRYSTFLSKFLEYSPPLPVER